MPSGDNVGPKAHKPNTTAWLYANTNIKIPTIASPLVPNRVLPYLSMPADYERLQFSPPFRSRAGHQLPAGRGGSLSDRPTDEYIMASEPIARINLPANPGGLPTGLHRAREDYSEGRLGQSTEAASVRAWVPGC